MENKINYCCSCCNRNNCKLWRNTSVFLEYIKMVCIQCIKDPRKKDIDSQGTIPTHFEQRTDQIGGMVPAVLTEDQETFWGYTSVPEKSAKMWELLPN